MRAVSGWLAGAALGFLAWNVMIVITQGGVARGSTVNLWDLFLLLVFLTLGGKAGAETFFRPKSGEDRS
jgi:hypothetical protein